MEQTDINMDKYNCIFCCFVFEYFFFKTIANQNKLLLCVGSSVRLHWSHLVLSPFDCFVFVFSSSITLQRRLMHYSTDNKKKDSFKTVEFPHKRSSCKPFSFSAARLLVAVVSHFHLSEALYFHGTHYSH